MKQGQWHSQITKINLDLSLSNPKTQNKHRESLGLGLHIRDGKVPTFKTIMRKVYEAQSRKYRGAQSMTVSSYVSKRGKEGRESSVLCQSTPLKSLKEDSFLGDQDRRRKEEVCVGLKQGINSVKQIKQAAQSNQIPTASPSPQLQSSLHVHHYRDGSRASINPYSGNQYLYLQNASRDSMILSRCSTSKKNFGNSITRSYKVSGMPLLPQQAQKRTLTRKKTLDLDKILLKQRKKKLVLRKASDVLPWQWHEQTKTQF